MSEAKQWFWREALRPVKEASLIMVLQAFDWFKPWCILLFPIILYSLVFHCRTVDPNPCLSNPCVNGECEILDDWSYDCQCEEDWEGENCNIKRTFGKFLRSAIASSRAKRIIKYQTVIFIFEGTFWHSICDNTPDNHHLTLTMPLLLAVTLTISLPLAINFPYRDPWILILTRTL